MSIFDKDVVVRKKLSEMARERDVAVQLWADGCKLLDQADSIVKQTARYGGPHTYDVPSPGKATKAIDSAYWRASFERTGMTQIMDAKATKQFHDSLERDPPVFSMANIESQYLVMYQDAEMMFQRGVYEVFRSLDSSYWNNNHQPYQISTKNILRGVLDTWAVLSGHGSPHLSYYRTDWVNDLDRCVKVITGRKHHARELESKINDALKGQDGPPWIYEDDDYHMKFYKNANCHLVFKNQDTIDRVNREIAAYCNHHQLQEAA